MLTVDCISQSSKEWCEVEGVITFTPNVTFKSPLFKEKPLVLHQLSGVSILCTWNLTEHKLKREDNIPILSKGNNLTGPQKMLQRICAWLLLLSAPLSSVRKLK